MSSDPLTLVYDAIWDLLEASDGLTSMIKPGCRIKFSGDRRSLPKDRLSSADVPEIQVLPLQCIPHLQRTSTSSSILCGFAVLVATGDKRVTEAHNPLIWEIYKALATWQSHLSELEWGEGSEACKFVKLARPTSVQESLVRRDINRGIQGWSAVWACEVELFFRTTDLQT